MQVSRSELLLGRNREIKLTDEGTVKGLKRLYGAEKDIGLHAIHSPGCDDFDAQ